MTFLSSRDVHMAAKRIAITTALSVFMPLAVWAHSTISNATGTCFPSGAVCTANVGGTAVGGVSGLEMDGLNGSTASSLTSVTDGSGTVTVTGTVTLTTGAYSASSFGTGKCATACTLGTFAAGTLTIDVTNYRGFSGTLFSGTFGDGGGISWIFDGTSKIKGVTYYDYTLTGAISGLWKGGPSTASGTTAQLFFQTTKPYTGGTISLADGSAAMGVTTPEPGSMGFMGTGLVMLGLLARKRAKQSISSNPA